MLILAAKARPVFSLSKRTFSKSFKTSHTEVIMNLVCFNLPSQDYSGRAGLNTSSGNHAGINIKKL